MRLLVFQKCVDGKISKIGPVGSVVQYPQGWLFISGVASHANGRKYRETPEQAVPKWVGPHYLHTESAVMNLISSKKRG